MVRTFNNEVKDPSKTGATSFLPSAQQLYQWLIQPLTAELEAQQINTLVFAMDTGLRSLPVAALHDGQKFLVEKYNLGLIPSVNLTDMRYRDIRQARILTMGASRFQEQTPLPAVPVVALTGAGWTCRLNSWGGAIAFLFIPIIGLRLRWWGHRGEWMSEGN